MKDLGDVVKYLEITDKEDAYWLCVAGVIIDVWEHGTCATQNHLMTALIEYDRNKSIPENIEINGKEITFDYLKDYVDYDKTIEDYEILAEQYLLSSDKNGLNGVGTEPIESQHVFGNDDIDYMQGYKDNLQNSNLYDYYGVSERDFY